MRRFLALCALFALLWSDAASAQCPDGSAPPDGRMERCGSRVRIDTNAFLVLPFEVSGPESVRYLRESMIDLLYMALDGVGGMRVEYAPTTLRRVSQLGNLSVVDKAFLARELGAGRLISGRVVALGSDVRIRADVYDATRGRLQYSLQRRASLENVAAAVDSLAAEVFANRGVPSAERRRLLMGEYATRSPKALHAYLIARQHSRRGERRAAADSLKSTLREDPDFGLAHDLLHRLESAELNSTGLDAETIYRRARERLTKFPERVQMVFDRRRADREGYLGWARGLSERFPADPDAAFYLADAYFHVGLNLGVPRAEVLATFRRAMELDDADPELLLHFVVLAMEDGDSASAKLTYEKCHAIAPMLCREDLAFRAIFRREDPRALVAGRDTAIVDQNHLLMRLSAFDLAGGLALTDAFAQLQTQRQSPSARAEAYVVRSNVALARGQFALADALLDSAEAFGPRRAALRMLHNIVTGTRESDATNATWNSGAMTPLAMRAWWSVLRQPPDSSEAYLAMLDRYSAPVHAEFARAMGVGLRGLRALRAGDTSAALDHFARMRLNNRRPTIPLRNVLPSAALALLHARIEAARGNFGRARVLLADLYPINDYVPLIGDVEESRAHVALALGDSTAARQHLNNLVAVWEKADQPLQSRVASARSTLAALERR